MSRRRPRHPGQFHDHPDRYLDWVRGEVPLYDRLQDELAAATRGIDVSRVLDLGTGTGETARRVLALRPEARLTGIDASPEMLEIARRTLHPRRVELRVGRLEDDLLAGPFDLCVSALAVHHLDGPGKADLFRRVRDVLGPAGRFVVADVVVPADPADAVTPLNAARDRPSTAADQLAWLRDAGFTARVTWALADLAVILADA